MAIKIEMPRVSIIYCCCFWQLFFEMSFSAIDWTAKVFPGTKYIEKVKKKVGKTTFRNIKDLTHQIWKQPKIEIMTTQRNVQQVNVEDLMEAAIQRCSLKKLFLKKVES